MLKCIISTNLKTKKYIEKPQISMKISVECQIKYYMAIT